MSFSNCKAVSNNSYLLLLNPDREFYSQEWMFSCRSDNCNYSIRPRFLVQIAYWISDRFCCPIPRLDAETQT